MFEDVLRFTSFLLKDKKGLLYWSFIMSIVLILTLVSVIIHRDAAFLPFVFQLCLVPIVCMSYYITSYKNYRRQFEIVTELDKANINYVKTIEIVVLHRASKTKAIRHNYELDFNSNVREVNCNFVKTADSVFLFYELSDLGLFKRYLAPICICKKDNEYVIKMKNSETSCNLFEDNNSLYISFDKTIYRIAEIDVLNMSKKKLFLTIV